MWTNKNLTEVIKRSRNKSDTLRNLGLKPFTGNYDTLNRYIKLFNIDISHFTRNSLNNYKSFKKLSLIEILIENSTYTSSVHLKERLYKEGIKERKCELCGQDEWWYGKKMSLILDHINGKHNDNRLENLQIVCPNCNGTLETHCGKNTKDRKIGIKRIKPVKLSKHCSDCGKLIRYKSERCLKCFNISQQKIQWPSYEQLVEDTKQLGYVGTGKKYGVSDNAIRKRIKRIRSSIGGARDSYS